LEGGKGGREEGKAEAVLAGVGGDAREEEADSDTRPLGGGMQDAACCF
jgi:hypothetical protein